MLRPLFCMLSIAMLTACGGAGEPGPAAKNDGPPEGYTRLRTPPIDLQPGESGLWAQWVADPSDRDLDVLDVQGWQSTGGHHALMYSTSDAQPLGTTRLWDDEDLLVTRFIGGVGNEPGATVTLPEGAVFRVKAGRSLLIQTHYVNPGNEPITAESYLDVKFDEPAEGRHVAGMFSNTNLAVDLAPAAEATMTIDCPLPRDVSLLMVANHMHQYGVSTRTTEILGDGTEIVVKDDPAWSYEWATNVNFASFTVEEPLVFHAGSTLRTECTWHNTEAQNVQFPDEMCVFFGFHLAETDFMCVGGSWIE